MRVGWGDLHEGDGVGVVVRVGDEGAALLAQVRGHGVGDGAQAVGHARHQLVHARQLRRARVQQHVHHAGVLHLTRTMQTILALLPADLLRQSAAAACGVPRRWSSCGAR